MQNLISFGVIYSQEHALGHMHLATDRVVTYAFSTVLKYNSHFVCSVIYAMCIYVCNGRIFSHLFYLTTLCLIMVLF